MPTGQARYSRARVSTESVGAVVQRLLDELESAADAPGPQ